MANEILLSIPGMKCNGCVSAVEDALKQQAGVHSFKVDLDSKTAQVEADAAVAELIQSIKSAGFDAEQV